jgi:hypothetical protein
LLFEGNGTGGWNAATVNGGILLEPKLPASQYPVLIGAGDFDVNGKIDLAAVDSAGRLVNFPGKVGNLTPKGTVIGNGWGPNNLVQLVR